MGRTVLLVLSLAVIGAIVVAVIKSGSQGTPEDDGIGGPGVTQTAPATGPDGGQGPESDATVATEEPVRPPPSIADPVGDPTSISGRAFDESGLPIEGALIQIYRNNTRLDTGTRKVYWDMSEEVILHETTTGPDGRFAFEGLPAETNQQLHATAPGFITQKKLGVRVGSIVDFNLLVGGAVEVTLLDAETGEPIEGAKVRAFYETPKELQSIARKFKWYSIFRTGADGKFSIDGAPAGDVVFLTFHADYEDGLSHHTITPRITNRVNLTAKRGLVIRGRVQDKLDESPVPGVRILVASMSGGAGMLPQHDVRTDKTGAFVIRGISRGQHVLRMSAQGYTDGQQALEFVDGNDYDPEKDNTLTFNMDPAGQVAGVVFGPDGSPVPGARIFAAHDARFTYQVRGPAETTTDASGKFLVNNLNAGTKYRIAAVMDGYAIGVSETLTVQPKELKDGVTLRLDEPRSVSGTVQDELGTPVPDATVRMLRPPFGGVWFVPGLDAGQSSQEVVVTGLDGHYSFEGIWPGNHTFDVEHPMYVPLTGAKIQVTDNNSALTKDFSLKIGRFIAGRVLLSGGGSSEGARVEAWDMATNQQVGTSTADSDGFYRIAGIEKGLYRVLGHMKGYSSKPLEDVPSDMDNVTLTLIPTGTLTGIVVGPDSAPASPFTLRLVPIVPRDDQRSVKAALTLATKEATFKDGTGLFAMEDIAPGRYALEVTSPRHARLMVPDLTVPIGGFQDMGTLVLPRGLTVYGYARDDSGRPVPAALVQFTNLTLEQGGPTAKDATGVPLYAPPSQTVWAIRTNDSGRFDLAGLPGGRYRVTTSADGYVAAEEQTLEGGDGESAELQFVMPRSARITLHITDDLGQTMASAVASVREAVSGRNVQIKSTPRSDGRGNMVITELPRGTFIVQLRRGGYMLREVTVEVTPGADQHYEVVLERIK